jgi:ubiquinone/menaquinone biosynthesis C-methylase UbiE
MENEKRQSLEETSESKFSYFELQAYMGTTKHMGGLETTKELIRLCHVDRGTYVLDVGCGAGATVAYLAKRHGCQVVGVDLRESMIARSSERARKEGIQDHVEFRVADVQDLPFEDDLFDASICESVATFIEDKHRVLAECARVTKSGGYVGVNEEIWIKTPPPAELVEFVKRTWDVESDIPPADGWIRLLEDAGLGDIVAKTYEFDARRESSQLRRYGFRDILRMLCRTASLYVRNSAFREYMKGRQHVPEHLFEYLGYGVFVGRK